MHGAGGGYGKEVDLWSCGVIMYVLLAGRLPFDGADPAAVIQKTIRAKLEFEPAAGTRFKTSNGARRESGRVCD